MNQNMNNTCSYNQRSSQQWNNCSQQPPMFQSQRLSSPSTNKKQKIVEVTVEKPVIVNKYVDVYEETIIEKPVERRMEKEVIVEKMIEKPVYKEVYQDVESFRHEFKEFVVEKQVEVEKFVDIPIQKIVPVPYDVVRQVDVKVPVQVDTVVDRTFLKPIENRYQENQIVVERPVVQERIVDNFVEVPVDKYFDVQVDRLVQREFITEVDKVIPLDRIVDRRVEKIIDVPVQKFYTKEVEVPVHVEKIVDKPYEVITEKLIQVPKEYTVENKFTVPVDRFVPKEVQKIVEVPVRHDIHTEVLFERNTEVPEFTGFQVDVPQPVYVDKPIEIENTIEVPTERIVENVIEVPFGKIVANRVEKQINVESKKLVEQSNYSERTVNVPCTYDTFEEEVQEEFVDKVINIQKIIEKPVVVPKYVDRYVDKVVETRITYEVPKVIEVPRTHNIDKQVDVTTFMQRASYNEVRQAAPVNTLIKRGMISEEQKRKFQETSSTLSNCVIENERVKAELQSAKQMMEQKSWASSLSGLKIEDKEMLLKRIAEVQNQLRMKEYQREKLRQTVSTAVELTVISVEDSTDIPKLQAHIQRVRAENESLRALQRRGGFSSQRRQVGTRVSHETTHREASVNTETRGSFVIASNLRSSQNFTQTNQGTQNLMRTSRHSASISLSSDTNMNTTTQMNNFNQMNTTNQMNNTNQVSSSTGLRKTLDFIANPQLWANNGKMNFADQALIKRTSTTSQQSMARY